MFVSLTLQVMTSFIKLVSMNLMHLYFTQLSYRLNSNEFMPPELGILQICVWLWKKKKATYMYKEKR